MAQAGVAERTTGVTAGARPGFLRRARRQLGLFARRYPLGFAGGVLLTLMGAAAALAPFIAPHDPLVQDIPNKLAAPSSLYWLGADTSGGTCSRACSTEPASRSTSASPP